MPQEILFLGSDDPWRCLAAQGDRATERSAVGDRSSGATARKGVWVREHLALMDTKEMLRARVLIEGRADCEALNMGATPQHCSWRMEIRRLDGQGAMVNLSRSALSRLHRDAQMVELDLRPQVDDMDGTRAKVTAGGRQAYRDASAGARSWTVFQDRWITDCDLLLERLVVGRG